MLVRVERQVLILFVVGDHFHDDVGNEFILIISIYVYADGVLEELIDHDLVDSEALPHARYDKSSHVITLHEGLHFDESFESQFR